MPQTSFPAIPPALPSAVLPAASLPLQVRQGDHIGLFYDQHPSEQATFFTAFIQSALTANEQIFYVADDQTVGDLAELLQRHGIDVIGETKRGRLKLWTRREWHPSSDLDTEWKTQQIRQLIDEAHAAGFSGASFAVEMTWALNPEISVEQLEHWEATLNTMVHPDTPGRIVCSYNLRRHNPDILMAALHTHPLIVLDGQLAPNLFYEAPLILAHGSLRPREAALGSFPTQQRFEWMISQLRLRMQEDLAERRRTERYVRHLAAIVEFSDDAIISKDLDGTIASWNRGAEKIFGYTAAEAVGKSITLLIPPDRLDEEKEILARIRSGLPIDHYETIRRRKDGALLDISVSVSPVKNDDGVVIGASKIARDITDKKRSEKLLAEANDRLIRANEALESRVLERTASLREAVQQMEEFSYTVSHDLRAPLRAISAYSQVLWEDFADKLPPEAHHYLKRMSDSATRLDKMILDVLTFSRIARADIQPEPVSLEAIVREVIEHYPSMQPPQASIRVEPLHDVLGHGPSLTQVVSNLLSNAVKFVPPEVTPQVHLWSEQHGDEIRLWIEDNGIGINPAYQHRLFNMFERLHPDLPYDGTGVGLAITRKAAERMGGKVGVLSDGKSGSRFWVTFPAVNSTAKSQVS